MVGTALQLSAKVTDKRGKTVTGVTPTWASSDQTIATVSSTGPLTAR